MPFQVLVEVYKGDVGQAENQLMREEGSDKYVNVEFSTTVQELRTLIGNPPGSEVCNTSLWMEQKMRNELCVSRELTSPDLRPLEMYGFGQGDLQIVKFKYQMRTHRLPERFERHERLQTVVDAWKVA